MRRLRGDGNHVHRYRPEKPLRPGMASAPRGPSAAQKLPRGLSSGSFGSSWSRTYGELEHREELGEIQQIDPRIYNGGGVSSGSPAHSDAQCINEDLTRAGL